jgi:hypothetical protein
MQFIARLRRFAPLIVMAMMAACAGQKEPAHKLLADIDATVMAASDEAAKYIPDQLKDVQSRYGALKASFDKKDYPAVVNGAPDVLAAAQDLATAAAAKKDQVLKLLDDQWRALAGSVPDSLTAIQNRIAELRKPSNKRRAASVNLDAAQSGLSDAQSLWSKAQAAFASGNLDEAVRTGQEVKTGVDGLQRQTAL